MRWVVDCLDCDLYAKVESLEEADEIADEHGFVYDEWHTVRVSRGEQ